jgi:hypothetical protein
MKAVKSSITLAVSDTGSIASASGGHGPRPEHQQAASAAQDLSVSVARHEGDAPQAGLVDRHHLVPAAARVMYLVAIID